MFRRNRTWHAVRRRWATVAIAAFGSVVLAVSSAEPERVTAAEPLGPAKDELVIYNGGLPDKQVRDVNVKEDLTVEIPPALHVHRYYYSGDKEYQAQFIAGGPTVVVAQHPKTGERCYINVTLPPGAPIVAYNKHSITYVYKDKRIVIFFPPVKSAAPRIFVLKGQGAARKIREEKREIAERIEERRKSSRLLNATRNLVKTHATRVKGVIGLGTTAAAVVVDKTGEIVSMLPGMKLLESVGDRVEEEQAIERVRQAGLEQSENAERFISTVR